MESKCWICGRTARKLLDEEKSLKIDGSLINDCAFCMLEDGLYVCGVCRYIIDFFALDQAEIKFNEQIQSTKVESKLVHEE